MHYEQSDYGHQPAAECPSQLAHVYLNFLTHSLTLRTVGGNRHTSFHRMKKFCKAWLCCKAYLSQRAGARITRKRIHAHRKQSLSTNSSDTETRPGRHPPPFRNSKQNNISEERAKVRGAIFNLFFLRAQDRSLRTRREPCLCKALKGKARLRNSTRQDV